MAKFSHLTIPGTRHPTAAARASLSAMLSIANRDGTQDWEEESADADRILEFMTLLASHTCNDDEEFLLLGLIFASVEVAQSDQIPKNFWHNVTQIISDNYAQHSYTIWHWASIDEETGIALNDFQISRQLQGVLLTLDKNQSSSNQETTSSVGSEFSQFWHNKFKGWQPASHLLRTQLSQRWVRFHSLPESRRYPADLKDRTILLDRQNHLADAVLGAEMPCWIALSQYGDDPIEPAGSPLANYTWSRSFKWTENANAFGDPASYTIFADECLWMHGQSNELLMQVADWKITGLFWISQKSGNIFAPYDGGIDVIMAKSSEMLELRQDFGAWLPDTPSGL